MKRFRCRCGNPIFFDNTSCVHCGRTLGHLPDQRRLSAPEPVGESPWATSAGSADHRCRMYANYAHKQVCNWMVAETDSEASCQACRLNHIIPNLTKRKNRRYGYRIELAKRQMLYNIDQLGLPVTGQAPDPDHGLAFTFLEDPEAGGEFVDAVAGGRQVLTGHRKG